MTSNEDQFGREKVDEAKDACQMVVVDAEIVATLLIAGTASAADVHVMISAGFYRGLFRAGSGFRARERPPPGHDARPVDG